MVPGASATAVRSAARAAAPPARPLSLHLCGSAQAVTTPAATLLCSPIGRALPGGPALLLTLGYTGYVSELEAKAPLVLEAGSLGTTLTVDRGSPMEPSGPAASRKESATGRQRGSEPPELWTPCPFPMAFPRIAGLVWGASGSSTQPSSPGDSALDQSRAAHPWALSATPRGPRAAQLPLNPHEASPTRPGLRVESLSSMPALTLTTVISGNKIDSVPSTERVSGGAGHPLSLFTASPGADLQALSRGPGTRFAEKHLLGMKLNLQPPYIKQLRPEDTSPGLMCTADAGRPTTHSERDESGPRHVPDGNQELRPHLPGSRQTHQQLVNGAWVRGLPCTLPRESPQPNAASVPAELRTVTENTDHGATDDMPPEPTLLSQAAESSVCVEEMQAPQVQEAPEKSPHRAAGCLPPAPLGHPAEPLADSELSQGPTAPRKLAAPHNVGPRDSCSSRSGRTESRAVSGSRREEAPRIPKPPSPGPAITAVSLCLQQKAATRPGLSTGAGLARGPQASGPVTGHPGSKSPVPSSLPRGRQPPPPAVFLQGTCEVNQQGTQEAEPRQRAGLVSALLSWGPGTFACRPCACGAAPDGQVLQVTLPPPTTLPSRAVPGSPHDALPPHTHVGVRVRGHACAVLAAKSPPLSPLAQDGLRLSESPSVHTGCLHTAVVNGKLGNPPCLRAIRLGSQLGDSQLAFDECLPVHLLDPPPQARLPPRLLTAIQIMSTLLILAHKALAPKSQASPRTRRDSSAAASLLAPCFLASGPTPVHRLGSRRRLSLLLQAGTNQCAQVDRALHGPVPPNASPLQSTFLGVSTPQPPSLRSTQRLVPGGAPPTMGGCCHHPVALEPSSVAPSLQDAPCSTLDVLDRCAPLPFPFLKRPTARHSANTCERLADTVLVLGTGVPSMKCGHKGFVETPMKRERAASIRASSVHPEVPAALGQASRPTPRFPRLRNRANEGALDILTALASLPGCGSPPVSVLLRGLRQESWARAGCRVLGAGACSSGESSVERATHQGWELGLRTEDGGAGSRAHRCRAREAQRQQDGCVAPSPSGSNSSWRHRGSGFGFGRREQLGSGPPGGLRPGVGRAP
nr:proline-rich protein 36-like [Kogia breviceps]